MSDDPGGLDRRSFGAWLVTMAAVIVAGAIGVASLTLAPPLSGRLQPWLVPAALAALVFLAAAISLWRPRVANLREAGPGLVPLAAAAIAVLVMAFGTRSLGIAVASLLSATIAAAGVVGVGPVRALKIGLGLSASISVLFSLALRQPLPVLPPGIVW